MRHTQHFFFYKLDHVQDEEDDDVGAILNSSSVSIIVKI